MKKKFQLKIAFATKQGDQEQLKVLQEALKLETANIEAEMKEKSEKGKAEIKERFNVLAQTVTIDSKTLVAVLVGNSVKKDLEDLNLD